MSRKIILIKQELLLLVYELNRSGLLAENEKIRPILAQLRSEERFSRNAETDLVCRLLLEKKKRVTPRPAGRSNVLTETERHRGLIVLSHAQVVELIESTLFDKL